MHGVIMAGGRGTRLKPLTDSRPKPLMPLLGRAVIDHVKDAMLAAGASNLVVTTGYRGEDLEVHVAGWRGEGISARVNHETHPMGTVGSVRLLIEELDDTFLVGSGDGVSTLDLGLLLQHHRATGAAVTIGLVEVDDPSSFGIVGLGASSAAPVDGDLREGMVVKFLEKPRPEEAFSRLINAGVYAVNPEVLSLVPEGAPFDFSRDLFPLMLEKGLPIAGIMLEGLWFDVGEPHHLLDAQACLLDDEVGSHCEEGVEVHESAVLRASLLMKGSSVAQGATVERSILGAGAKVGAGATLIDCVLGDGAIVHEEERLTGVRRAGP